MFAIQKQAAKISTIQKDESVPKIMKGTWGLKCQVEFSNFKTPQKIRWSSQLETVGLFQSLAKQNDFWTSCVQVPSCAGQSPILRILGSYAVTCSNRKDEAPPVICWFVNSMKHFCFPHKHHKPLLSTLFVSTWLSFVGITLYRWPVFGHTQEASLRHWTYVANTNWCHGFNQQL